MAVPASPSPQAYLSIVPPSSPPRPAPAQPSPPPPPPPPPIAAASPPPLPSPATPGLPLFAVPPPKPAAAPAPGVTGTNQGQQGAAAAAPQGQQPCRADVISLLRASGDLDTYMILLALTGWLKNVSEPGLAATLFIPQNSAIDAFMAQQGFSLPQLFGELGRLKSLVAYHMLPQPLSYTDLLRQGGPIPTDLPGSSVTVTQGPGGALVVQGGSGTANIVRTNILLCSTVVHVIDTVLTPTARLQFIMPYDMAVQGVEAQDTPATGLPGQACAHSLADIVRQVVHVGIMHDLQREVPNLSVLPVYLSMADWDKQLQDPGWNVTLIMPADQVFSVAAAFLLQPGVADARQVLLALASSWTNTPYLHEGGKYFFLQGGLSVNDLKGQEGDPIPTMFQGQGATVIPLPTDDGEGVGIQYEGHNMTLPITQEYTTCGGAVLWVLGLPSTGNQTQQASLGSIRQHFSPGTLQELAQIALAAIPSIFTAPSGPSPGGSSPPAPPASAPGLTATQPPATNLLHTAVPVTATAPAPAGAAAALPPASIPGASSTPTATTPLAVASAPGAASGVTMGPLALNPPPSGAFPGAPPSSTPASLSATPTPTPTAALAAPVPALGFTSALPAGGPGGGTQGGAPQGCLPVQRLYMEAPEFTSLRQLLGAAHVELTSLYAPQASVTILAPINRAVDDFLTSLDQASRVGIFASQKAVVALLAYNTLAPPPLRVADMQDGAVIASLATDAVGASLPVAIRRPSDANITLQGIANSAHIVYPDVAICEGILQATDAVLIPVQPQAAG
ncbi:hypothetical protein N2152v2_003209 [Parachlorella kessleri]